MAAIGRGGAADGEATRTALLDAAVRLFASDGIDAVSVRGVNRAAGVAPAAVHYHFGSKSALLDAVIARHGEPVAADIGRRCGLLLERPGAPTARELIEAVSEPYRALLDAEPASGRAWLEVIAQLSLAGDDKLERPTRELNALLLAVAARAFPTALEPELARALRLALITLIQMLAHPTGRAGEGDLRPYADVVVDFVTGGLVAAATGLPVQV